MGFMDHVVCHQDHTRHGRPSAPSDIDGVVAAMSNRTDHLTSGMRSANLPEARMHDIFTAGYNPESPFLAYPHHHLFRMYEDKLWTREVQHDYITDFLGIRTPPTMTARTTTATASSSSAGASPAHGMTSTSGPTTLSLDCR